MPHVVNVTKSEDIPRDPIDGKPTLVYWNIVCYAHAIRLALAYARVDFVDVRVDPGDPHGDSYKQVWFDVKPAMANLLTFPNLPYLLDDGGVALSQSDTILRHIGRKYFPPLEDEAQHRTLDLVLDELKDQENGMTKAAYSSRKDLDCWCQESLPGVLHRFSRLLEHNSYDFLLANRPSIADFKLYQFLYRIPGVKYRCNDCSGNSLPPRLQTFLERIETTMPTVGPHQFLPHPLHSPHAFWIGTEADAI